MRNFRAQLGGPNRSSLPRRPGIVAPEGPGSLGRHAPAHQNVYRCHELLYLRVCLSGFQCVFVRSKTAGMGIISDISLRCSQHSHKP